MTNTIRRFWLYLRGITNTFGSRFGKRLSPIAAMVMVGLAISLSVWSATRHSYNTAKKCEHACAHAKVVITPNPTQTDLFFYCISSDDPRLR